jgi:hypothetical protein
MSAGTSVCRKSTATIAGITNCVWNVAKIVDVIDAHERSMIELLLVDLQRQCDETQTEIPGRLWQPRRNRSMAT